MLCLCESPGKISGVAHFLLQGIFLLHPLHWQADSLPPSRLGSPLREQRVLKQGSIQAQSPGWVSATLLTCNILGLRCLTWKGRAISYFVMLLEGLNEVICGECLLHCLVGAKSSRNEESVQQTLRVPSPVPTNLTQGSGNIHWCATAAFRLRQLWRQNFSENIFFGL